MNPPATIRLRSAGCRGFSLIEIVLAIGIISFSLVAILGLFGSSLRSNNETISLHEMMGVSRSVSDFLSSTNPASGAGFSNVYGWVQSPSSEPGIYSFVQENGQITNGIGSDVAFVSSTAKRSGRLFRILLSLSPNMPIKKMSGSNESLVARPTVSDLPASAAEYTNDASLAVQIKVYSVPATGISVTNLLPAFTYDTMVKK